MLYVTTLLPYEKSLFWLVLKPEVNTLRHIVDPDGFRLGAKKSGEKKPNGRIWTWCEPKFKYPGSMVRSAQIVHYEFTAQLNKMCFYCKWDLFNGDHLRVSRNSLTFFYSKKIELNLIYMQRRPLLLCKSNKIHWHFNYNSVRVHQGIRWLSVRPNATEKWDSKQMICYKINLHPSLVFSLMQITLVGQRQHM